MEVRKGISSRRALLLGFLLGGSSLAQMALAINVGFDPATLNLSAGERALVAVTVTDVPAPGLAALEFELAFDPSLINLYNPNEAYKASGITSFAPLAGNPFCPIVRGDDISDPCPDPEWFLTSSGRTAESGAAIVDNLTGRVLMSFGTTSPPSEQPTGDGVVALIEVEGTGNGSGAVSFDKGILADATPTPYQGISFDTLIVNVGGVGNQAPSIDPIQPIAINEGGSVTVPVAASDNDGDNLSFSSSGMPDFVSLSDNGDGTAELTVSPSYGDAGSYAGDIRVTDDGSPASSTTTSVDISVLASNRPPQLDPIPDRTSAEGESVVVTASASDPDGDTLLFSASGLPDGVVIDSVSGNITGVIGYETAGSYTVAVRVTDSGTPLRYAEQTFVWEVANSNRAPELGHISDVSLAEGETLSIPLSATDADGDSLTYNASGLPAFASMSGSTLTVAPGFEDAGSYPVTVEVSDGTETDTQTFTIVVGGTNQAPSIASPGAQTSAEGDTVNLALIASDADGDALSYAATGLPAGVSIDPATGVISGSLDYDSEGTYNVTVTVTDNGSPTLTANASFTWSVTETNRAPELAAVSDQTVAEGESLTVTLSATDADGDALTYSATGLPAFASLSGSTLTVTPGFEDAGSYPVTVEVSDGTETDSQTFTIVVGGTNQAPSITSPGAQASAEGDTVNLALIASDADGDALSYAATGLPAGVSIDPATGVISGALDYESEGTYNVTVTVTDNGSPALTANASFTWTVTETNRAPELATVSDQAVAEGESLTVTLSATDADGDALTYSATGLPAFASLSGNTLTVAPGFEDAGSYPVTVEVSDGPETDRQSFTIVVDGTNRAPVLDSVSDQTVAEGDTLTMTLSAVDADGDALTYSATGLPAFASLSGSTLTVTPGFEDAGSYPVTVEVSDGTETDSQTFTIVVGGTNQAPSITSPGAQTSVEGDSVNLALIASDADGDALTYAATGLPAGVSIDPATGVISGALDYESEGTYNVTVTVTDNGSPTLTANASFTWSVTETNRAPELAAVSDQTVAEGESLTVTLSATDADGDALTYSASGLPAFASMSGNTLTIVPGQDDAGSYPMTVEVSDGEDSDSQSFTVVINEGNTAPTLAPVSDLTVSEGETRSVGLSASDAEGNVLVFSSHGLPDFITLNDAGDGSAQLTVTPGYSDEGDYSITLTVSEAGDSGLSDSKTLTVEVTDSNRPPAVVVGDDRNVLTGSLVTLDGSSSSDADGDRLTFEWRFVSVPSDSVLTDDNLAGRFSSQASFTVDSDGEYLLELEVADGTDTGVARLVVTATTANVAPNAEAGNDRFVQVFETVVLDGSASNDPDSQPLPLTYEWALVQVPSGSTQTQEHIAGASSVTASFVPEVEGGYAFELTVSDGEASDSDLVVIDVRQANVPPTASAGEDQIVDLGESVLVDGSASQDPDNYPNSLSYQWGFVSAPSASSLGDEHIAGAFESIAGFNPDVAGEYILRLMVTDGEASHSDQVVVSAREPAQLPWTPTGVIGRARAYHVNLVWNESEYADNYVVYRRLDTESGFTALGSTTTLAFVDDMPTGTRYADYQVVAHNANGQSDPSTVVRLLPRVRSR